MDNRRALCLRDHTRYGIIQFEQGLIHFIFMETICGFDHEFTVFIQP